MEEVEKLNSEYSLLRDDHKEYKDLNKKLNEEYRKLINKKTFDELETDELELIMETEKLRKKLEYLVGEDTVKVDEK